MRSTLRAIAAAAGVATAALPVHALTDNTSTLRTGTMNYSTNSGASYGNYDTGARKLSDGSSSFWAYCIDPLTGVDFSQTYAQSSLENFFNGSTSSGYASEIGRSNYTGAGLTNSAAAQAAVLANLKELYSHAYADSLTSAAKSAAFGMAVWEVVMQDWSAVSTDATFANTSGRVRSNGNTGTLGDTATDTREAYLAGYLNALSTNNWGSLGLASVTNWTYTVYYDAASPYTQSFLAVTGSVPVPATISLVGLGLAGIALGRRRARRQAQA